MQKIDYLKAMNIPLWVSRTATAAANEVQSNETQALLDAIYFALGEDTFPISTETLNQCLIDPKAKKQLWQDICASMNQR